MTNILVLPDIHGRTFWKEPLKYKDKFDHIIFLGDYFDPYPSEGITPEEAVNNFKEILKTFTEDEIDGISSKVEFLLGNHDAHYIIPDTPISSRYCRNKETQKNIINLFKYLQLHHQLILNTWITIENTTYLFTHAGINKEWFDSNSQVCDINTPGLIKQYSIPNNWVSIAQVGRIRGGFGAGGPLWDDVREFVNQPKFSLYYQIFGHTQLNDWVNKDKIKEMNKGKEVSCEDFACLDCRQAFVIDEKGIQPFNVWINS